jgi:hypothetical protein
MMRVKICGINSPLAFDTAVAAEADWVGFVFFARSPRAVSPGEAAALSARRDGGPLRVGLFVAPADAEIADALASVRLDVLQLYVDPARAADVRARFGVPVWRAVGATGHGDLPARSDGADGFVVEPKAPPGATRPGGNAVAGGGVDAGERCGGNRRVRRWGCRCVVRRGESAGREGRGADPCVRGCRARSGLDRGRVLGAGRLGGAVLVGGEFALRWDRRGDGAGLADELDHDQAERRDEAEGWVRIAGGLRCGLGGRRCRSAH